MNRRALLAALLVALVASTSLIAQQALAGSKLGMRSGRPGAVSTSDYTTGQSIAKSGAVQYPHLLDASSGTNTNGVSIPYRPAWAVAGVDYRVGPSSTQSYTGKTLPGDSANLPACASLDTTNRLLRINSTPCTIDGWDIGAYQIYDQNASGTVIIRNNKFDNTVHWETSFYQGHGANTDVTIEFNDIFADLYASSQSSQFRLGSGNYTIQMNYIHNIGEDVINADAVNGLTSGIFRWNLVVNYGAQWQVHGDVYQGFCPGVSCTGGADWNGIDMEGNTIYQEYGNASFQPAAANTLMRLGDSDVGSDYVSPTLHHNTAVSIGTNHTGNIAGAQDNTLPGFINLLQAGDATVKGNITNLTVHDNYFFSDSTGYASTQRTLYGTYYQGHAGTTTYTISPNNVYMWDGTTWPTTLP